MYCPNCNTLNEVNDSFCKNCGTSLKMNVQNNTNVGNQQSAYNYQNQLNYNTQMNVSQQSSSYNEQNLNNSYNQGYYQMGSAPQNVVTQPMNNNVTYNYNTQFQNSNVNNNDDLIDAYIGKNVDKIKSKSFSFLTFLFGALYIFYRKMWGMAFLYMLISLFASVIPFGSLILSIVFAVKFKDMYLKKATERLEKIVTDNPGKSRDELRKICAQKGGTTLVPVILIPLVLTFVIFLIAVPIILSTVDNGSESAAKSEAMLIVSGVNNYCASAEMKYEYYGTYNPCSDGVS